jgi:AcrR family transcriptional regulator
MIRRIEIRIPMSKRSSQKKPVISPRKRPSQRRSSMLVADILEAAVRVLVRDGARHFTTARVAEEAGVSVGSLYQYFPNKESILFRLQAQEWEQTGDLLERVLTDDTVPQPQRLRNAIVAFFRSETAEAQLRIALADAAPLYRDAPESREHRERGPAQAARYLKDLLPDASARERLFLADLFITCISSLGKTISEQRRTEKEIDRFANAVSDMLLGYVRAL